MLNEVINVGDLRKTVKESTKEFNAKMGVGVETENKKNNEKSYKESSKKIEDFDGGIRNTARKIERSDDKNRTVLDYTPSIEPDEKYKKQSFDPNDEYSIPYMWGTVGIVYNTDMVKEPIDSWNVLWDKKYEKQILMLNSERDSIGITLKLLGYSLNTTDEKALNLAKEKLIEQKPNTLAYVGDQVKDQLIAKEAAMAVVWSGDAINLKTNYDNFEYVIPKEGSNVWIDSAVILKGTKNKEAAEKFLNFLSRPDIALKNAQYIGYATPNTEAVKQLDPKITSDKDAYPDEEKLKTCEIFENLSDPKVMQIYSKIWLDVLAK